MNFRIDNANRGEIFTNIFQTVKTMTDHTPIMFKTDGLYMQVMDNAKVSIVELFLPSEWFNEYNCEIDVTIGINSNILYKILNTREKTQTIEVIYNDQNNDTLSINFTSESKVAYDKSFLVPLVDIEIDQMTIPEIEYVAEFSVASNIFANLMNQLKQFGETLDISCSEERITMSSNSYESGKMAVEIKIDDLETFAIDEGEQLNISFSLNYMQQICCCNKLSKDIELKLCDQYPLSVIYDLEDQGSMKFYLAPKMDE